MLENSVSIPLPFLDSSYTALKRVQIQNVAIEETIDLFFSEYLKNYFQYEIVKNDNWVGDEEVQIRTVHVSKTDTGIGAIGTVIFRFSENSVEAISDGNPVISTLIINSNFPGNVEKIVNNKPFLRFGCSVERFNTVKPLLNKQKNISSILGMNFWGTITEAPGEHAVADLAYEIVIEEQRKYWASHQLEVDELKWTNRGRIVDALTQYLKGDRDLQNIKNMREAATVVVEAEGINPKVAKSLAIGACGLIVLGFMGAIALITAGILIAGTTAGLPLILTGIVLGAWAFLSLGMGDSISNILHKKPDFLSRAALYLADKIEKESLSGDDVPVITLENPSSSPKATAQIPQPSIFQFTPTSEEASEKFKQSFEEFCATSLKSALAKAFEKENINIDDNDKIFKSLKDGLATQLNENPSMTIEQLKTKIEIAAARENPQECLNALYHVCGVEKPNDFNTNFVV